MKSIFQSALKIAAVAGFVASASSAQAGLTFTVDEGSVAGAMARTFTADRIDGTWAQRLNFAADGSITAGGFLSFSTYNFNNAPRTSQLSSGEELFPQQYGMYAIYTWSGMLSGTTVTSTGGSVTLFMDPLQNTGKTPPGSGSQSVNLDNLADDYALGSAPVLLGGTVDPLPAPASWSLVYDAFTLTANGSAYFTQPGPFWDRLQLSSEINQTVCINDDPVTLPCDSLASGAGSLQFIPEPGMLTLLGISLVGLGLARRRSKVA